MHVLLIGVGGYPFLTGGENQLPQTNDLARLRQLSSPQFSVEAIYNTLLDLNPDPAVIKRKAILVRW